MHAASACAQRIHAVAEDLAVQGRTTLGSEQAAGAAGATAPPSALSVRGSAEVDGGLHVGQNATGKLIGRTRTEFDFPGWRGGASLAGSGSIAHVADLVLL